MVKKSNSDLKNRKRYTASFDLKLFEALMKHSKETEVPFSKLLDRCMRKYLEDNKITIEE